MRILADTSVWIDHFRNGNEQLAFYLQQDRIVVHEHIIGELALGSIQNRQSTLASLDRLMHIDVARDHEVRILIEERNLVARGIGYVDAHLLAATAIDGQCRLWTLDRRLLNVARELSLSVSEAS